MACRALHHEEAEKISEAGAVMRINHHILNETQSYRKLERPSSVIGTIVFRILHHLGCLFQ